MGDGPVGYYMQQHTKKKNLGPLNTNQSDYRQGGGFEPRIFQINEECIKFLLPDTEQLRGKLFCCYSKLDKCTVQNLPIQRTANSVKKCGDRDKSREVRFWHPRLKMDHKTSSVRPEINTKQQLLTR